MSGVLEKAHLFLIGFLISLLPVLWIPFISPNDLKILKSIFIFILFVIALTELLTASEKRYSLSIPKLLAFMILLIQSFYFYYDRGVLAQFNFLILLVAPLILSNSNIKNYPWKLRKIQKTSLIFFSFFALFTIYDWMSGGILKNELLGQVYFLHQTGFSGGRTNWGYISCLFIAVALGLTTDTSDRKEQFFLYIFSVILLCNILVIQARGALILSFFIICIHSFTRFKRSELFFTILLVLPSLLMFQFFLKIVTLGVLLRF